MSKEYTQRLAKMSTLKLAFAAQQFESKIGLLKAEPIAIIGMGCRFPGGVDSPEKFWQLLQEGVDAITEVPKNRWDIDAYYDPDSGKSGKIVSREGGFLTDVENFDANFFNIAPIEAISLDPQQRLLLEVSWEALENAHQVPENLFNSLTGVFVGISTHDYSYRLWETKEPDAYFGTGNTFSATAGRLSYVLGLTGPCLAVETACSSSLVGVHLACQSLRNRECNLAIAGGVNLILAPQASIVFSQAQMLSPDGRCKTFDASANGYVRGEGCGVIVLKRLSDAIADQDQVLAVIRGSAVNQDGPSGGLTVPNGPSQEAVISQALQNGGVDPTQVSYVEAHGTGTSLGDPIEVEALNSVFSPQRAPDNPLQIGAVKTNIGHLEAASGIAGLIKVVLQLQHQEIAPHLNLEELNPYLNWETMPIVVRTKSTPWKVASQRRIAGVSSFGFSGTNAHVVLEESEVLKVKSQERSQHLLTLSAKTETALQDLAQRYHEYLSTHAKLEIGDICFSSNVGRSHFEHRLAVVVASSQELAAKLDAFNSEEEVVGLSLGKSINASKKSRIAFLFTGQGSQYVGMGQELFQTQPLFRQTLEKCQEILSPYLEIPLLKIIYPNLNFESALLTDDRSLITDNCSLITDYAQPAIFAIEYALATLWQSWGIEPDVVMGHSVGEYVAACIAGVFSLEDALILVAHRGRLMQQLPAGGGMVALMASAEQAENEIAPYAQQVAIAAFNGPTNIVISGEQEALDAICQGLEKQGIKTKALQVSHAFHSQMMEPMLEEFAAIAGAIKYHEPQINLISNVTVKRITEEIATPEYWVNHVRQPVRFAESVKILNQEGYEIFLEIGSRPILLGMARQCLADKERVWLPSLRPEQDDWQQILDSLAQLYVQGFEIDWQKFNQDYSYQKVTLPTYPWQRERYWIETDKFYLQTRSFSSQQTNIHPLLGDKLLSAIQSIQFEAQISSNEPAYLAGHRVFGEALFPATAYLEMALAAGQKLLKSPRISLENIVIQQGLILPEFQDKTVQTILNSLGGQIYEFQIFSLNLDEVDEPNWTLHTSGKIKLLEEKAETRLIDLETCKTKCQQPISVPEYYQKYGERGINYGDNFQAIQNLWCGEDKALAQIKLPENLAVAATEYQLHPVLLDASFQVLAAAFGETANKDTYLPVGIENLSLYRRPSNNLWAYVEVDKIQSQTLIGEVYLFNNAGEAIAKVEGFQGKRATSPALLGKSQEPINNSFYQVEWRSKPSFSKQLPLDYFPNLTEVEGQLLPVFSQLSKQDDLRIYETLIPDLEALSIDYLVEAFSNLGWTFSKEQTFSTVYLSEQLEVVAQQQRLLARLLQMLVEVNILEGTDSQWKVLESPQKVFPKQKISNLGKQYTTAKAELKLLQRCGEKLAQVLQGKCDPVQLIFPEGNLTTATQLYQESPGAKATNSLVQKAINIALEKLPASRGVRILEIGAGTGGTTSYILPQLNPEQTEYLFTDIGALFTAKAQEKFQQYSFIDYQTLDIEIEPDKQGFETHQYDIVVAANVIHATADLSQTLAYIHQLLSPGGLLILVEGTTPQRWVDLTFGLLEGWWKFTDVELRPDYPLIRGSQWQQLLLNNGFEQVVTIPSNQEDLGILSRQAVIVAQARDTVASTVTAPAKVWLVLADEEGIAEQLSAQINSRKEVSILAKVGTEYEQLTETEFIINPHEPEHFQQLLATVGSRFARLEGIIQCWSLLGIESNHLTNSDLGSISHRVCGTTLSLVQALVNLPYSPHLWLITQGAQPVADSNPSLSGLTQASLWGLGRAIALEHPELNCTCIDLDPEVKIEEQAKALWAEILAEDKEDRVGFRQNNRYVARLVAAKQQDSLAEHKLNIPSGESFQLTMPQRGTLENLALEATKRRPPAAGEVEIQVMATGLNFRDVLIAIDIYPGDSVIGGECAGQIVAVGEGVEELQVGDAVIAIAPGSFSKYLTVNTSLVVPKPKNLTFEQAAAIPVNFLTAYYTLEKIAKIQPGEKILIHSAAGGTGMAAVQIAQQAGAEIFATASPPKWESLKSMGVEQIMNSRTLDFAEQIAEMTASQGVDIVLNSLTSGEFVAKSLSVVANQGLFLELAQREVWDSHRMTQARPDIAYKIINLVQISQQQPGLIRSMLLELIDKFEQGILQPPPLKIFPIEEVATAFRYMQQAQHIGKIVVTQSSVPASPESITFKPDGTYLITGGLGGLGLLVARWMIEQGAKYLVLVGRSGASDAAQSQLQELEEAGARIIVHQADVSQLDSLTEVFSKIKHSLPPLRGVIHSVGVLDDGVIQHLSWERFEQVMAPKVQGAWNLHQLSREIPLDFFVLFSSVASLLGSPGQSNHCAANAFLDSLAYYRREQGFPGLSINWGVVGEIGAAAQRKAGDRIKQRGIGAIAPEQVLEALEFIINNGFTEIGVVPIRWSDFMQQWSNWQFLADFEDNSQSSTVVQSEFLQQLESTIAKERRELLTNHVRWQVIKVLGLNSSHLIELQQGFFELGMDSLTSIELRNRLQTSLGLSIPLTASFDYPTVGELIDYLITLLDLDFAENSVLELQPEQVNLVNHHSPLENLSDEEAETSLLDKLDKLGY
ncbi:MAG: SDR family NAD(P)-dependent oxidoreductase [Cyanobacteria bacterium P01_F01_bin.143]